MSFYNRFLDPSAGLVGQVIEDEERKDEKAIEDFSKVLADKLLIFEFIVNKRLLKFIYKYFYILIFFFYFFKNFYF